MRSPPPRRANAEERILPLINVVFLLLIFFMLAGRLAATDPFEIVPPRSHGAGPTQTEDMQVLVGRDGRLALDGETLDEVGLGLAVAARLGDDDNARVRLKADGNAEATRVVAVMELLREAGVTRLTLLTLPEPG